MYVPGSQLINFNQNFPFQNAKYSALLPLHFIKPADNQQL